MMNRRNLVPAIAIAGLALAAFAAPSGAALVIPGDAADALVRDSTGGNDQGGTVTVLNTAAATLRTGRLDTNGATAGGSFNSASIFVFQLPNVGAITNPFTSASFSFNLNSLNNSPGYAVDLYGIDARDAATVLTSDFYVSGTADPSTDTERLQDFILNGSSSTGSHTSDDISTWLNGQYAGGTNAGDYVFMRLNARHTNVVVNNQTNGYIFATSEDLDAADRPILTIEVIPTPAALPAGIALLGLVAMRHRRA